MHSRVVAEAEMNGMRAAADGAAVRRWLGRKRADRRHAFTEGEYQARSREAQASARLGQALASALLAIRELSALSVLAHVRNSGI